MFNKILMLLLILCVTPTYAAAPPDPKYCTMLQKLQPNMTIGDVFLLMGPPMSFGQPPNLDPKNLSSASPVTQPQTNLSQDPAAVRQRILASMEKDPILGSFMNAPPDYTNVLIWEFENKSLSVSVKVKGPLVTDVKANFSCS